MVTPLVADGDGVYLKCDFLHPGRSHKARVASALVDDAEARGLAGKRLLERTGGNLGVALAIEAKARGYHLVLVVDPGYSAAKKNLARRYGATVLDREVEFPQCRDNGEAVAALLAAEPDTYHYLNQFANVANPQAHERVTGPEIAGQLAAGGVCSDATVVLVSGTGTGATMRGVSTALRRHFATVVTLGVEPPHCDLLAGRYGEHPLHGIAVGQSAPFFPPQDLDGIVAVTPTELDEARQLLLTRHCFDVGPTSVANYAALRQARQRRPECAKSIWVTLLFDRGEDYA
ncbi:pyridoxal-phosphate dependent enzyme [Streptomyces sp. NPDC023327]|uniref:PLP-dependent cysteine synthase family protein n=1 Tax=Streptomyces sp. NPDC023327 TaxID=3157088 RepID=UPI0033C41A6E